MTMPYRPMTTPSRPLRPPVAAPLHHVLPARSVLLLAALAVVLAVVLVAAG